MSEDLLNKYFAGSLTSKERDSLMKELESNEKLQKDFCELKKIKSLLDLAPQPADKRLGKEGYNNFKYKRKLTSTRIVIWRHIAGYAAAICITFMATYLLNSHLLNKDAEEEIAYLEFSTPAGQRAQMILSDGSTVWLNAKSTLRYPNKFSKGVREVELDGEGYFDITHNAEMPFIVATNKAHVEVLGTAFNLFAYSNQPDFEAILVEGKINVFLPDQPEKGLVIDPNQMVKIEDGKMFRARLDNPDKLLWTEGIYAFDHVPFIEIVEKLELYYDIEIIVKNQNLASSRFSGKFRQRDGVESVLRTLSRVRNFKFTKDSEKNQITIH